MPHQLLRVESRDITRCSRWGLGVWADVSSCTLLDTSMPLSSSIILYQSSINPLSICQQQLKKNCIVNLLQICITSFANRARQTRPVWLGDASPRHLWIQMAITVGRQGRDEQFNQMAKGFRENLQKWQPGARSKCEGFACECLFQSSSSLSKKHSKMSIGHHEFWAQSFKIRVSKYLFVVLFVLKGLALCLLVKGKWQTLHCALGAAKQSHRQSLSPNGPPQMQHVRLHFTAKLQ